MLLILFPIVLLYLRSDIKHSLILILIWAIPFLVTLPWTIDLIMSTARSLVVLKPLPANHDLPRIMYVYGYIPVGLALLGVFVLVLKGGVKNYGLVFGLMISSLMLATFYTLHYGDPAIYLRGILYVMLMLGVAAGAGLMAIKNLELPAKLGLPVIIRRIGYPICFALIIVILLTAIPSRQDIPYYLMIDKEDYEAFIWIRDNVDESHQMAVLDPWKATAFTALTGKYVHARTHTAPTSKDKKTLDFLNSGCKDTAFLSDNGISIVYNRSSCSNPDLVEVRKNVYLLKDQEHP